MLLAWSVAVWKNPDLPPSPDYAAWVAGTLVVWFLLAGDGGWLGSLWAARPSAVTVCTSGYAACMPSDCSSTPPTGRCLSEPALRFIGSGWPPGR